MTDYGRMEARLREAFSLRRRPIAITFRDAPPAGVARFSGTEPSSCSFWRLAAGGRTFYTVPTDHYNCAIGSHTHNVPLPPDRAEELTQTLGFITGLGYVKPEEVAGIPRLSKTPEAIVYAPLGDTPVDPDVVLIAGRPGPLMRLLEAGIRAGVHTGTPVMGRPTCTALPAALAHGMLASAGCVGNRVYTDLGDDELYVAVPGRDLGTLLGEADTIAVANVTLADYHRARRRALSTE
jgi:uncharacterized protein (DUF169 family)